MTSIGNTLGYRYHDWTVIGYVDHQRLYRCSCGVERTPKTTWRGGIHRALRKQWLYRLSESQEWAQIRMPPHPEPQAVEVRA